MKILVLYYSPKSAVEAMSNIKPEDMEGGMKPWMDWAVKCGTGLLDMGTPLANAHKMSKDFHGESESRVTGYSILQAESWDKLKEMMDNHPHMMMGEGCEIEIHESMPLPGMDK